MKSFEQRIAELEQRQPGPASAYVVYSDVGDYVWADGVKYDLELFRIRFPRVAVDSLKAYGATAEWNPEDI